MLKISEQKGVGDRYTLEQFYTLSSLFVDEVPQVREKILVKLHKVRIKLRFFRGIPSTVHNCSLSGLEQEHCH